MSRERSPATPSEADRRWTSCCPDAFVGTDRVGLLTELVGLEGPIRPDEAKAALERSEDLGLVLLYPAPEHFVTLSADTAPQAEIDRWISAMRVILAVFRTARHRSMLLEVGMALRHPHDVARKLGLGTTGVTVPDDGNPPRADPLVAALVHAALVRDSSVQTLLGEIEISSLNLPDDALPNGNGTDAALARYRELEIRSARCAAMEEELSRLRREIVASNASADRMASLEAQLAQNRGLTADLERHLSDSFRGCGTLQTERDTSNARLAIAEAEIERLLRSRSFRLTGPIRRLRSILVPARRRDE